MNKTLVIEIDDLGFDIEIPETQRYLASLKDPKLVVTGKSIPECLRELATSLEVTEKYEQNR